jgi:predicted phage-related endonuclease
MPIKGYKQHGLHNLKGYNMNLRSKKDTDLAAELYEINNQRKELEKREKEIKEYFKEKMGDEQTAIAGNYVLLLKVSVRNDLDKDALAKVVDLNDYKKPTSYKQFFISLKNASK